MEDLCPLCLKNGFKKKIRLLQINLREAVWMCEEEKCVWPFGYENFEFYSRLVGKIWSCYWNDIEPPRLKENVISVKPSQCDVSVTSIKNAQKEIVYSNLDTNPLEGINSIDNDISVIDSKFGENNVHSFTQKGSNMVSGIDSEEQCSITNTLGKEMHDPNQNDNNKQLDNNKSKNETIESQHDNALDVSIKKEGVFPQDIKTVNIRGIPKITSIEKTNIDISNVKKGNQVSVYQEHINDIKHNSQLSLNNQIQFATDSLKDIELSKLESCKNNQLHNEAIKTKSNLNVTTMEIDGLPPITLSFEIPATITAPEIVTSNTTPNDTKLNGLDVKNSFARRHLNTGKTYEKFSFSAIKKKLETNNSTDTSSNNNNSSGKKLESERQDIGNNSVNTAKEKNCTVNGKNCTENDSSNDDKQTALITKLNDSCTLNQVNTSEFNLSSQDISLNQENISSCTINASLNIDTVLEDLLNSNYSVSENINDEWLESLLR